MKATFLVCLTTTVLAVAMAAAQSPGPARPAPPQEKAAPPAVKRPPAPAPEVPEDDPWEEHKARAREDVEYLEALLRAKLTECREAELRNKHALALKSDLDRQKQKGYASTFVIHQGEMSIAESQSQLEMRRVELKDAEIRLARARRRLKAVERSPSAYEAEAPQSDDRLRELELKYERLRREFELSKRLGDLHKTRP